MALTEVQLAKLIVEIDKLTTEATRLEKQAEREDASFLESARTYGSELAGSSGTERLYEQIRMLRWKIEFLERVKSGAIPLTNYHSWKRRLELINSEIMGLTTEKETLELNLKEFELVHKLLSI